MLKVCGVSFYKIRGDRGPAGHIYAAENPHKSVDGGGAQCLHLAVNGCNLRIRAP